MVISYKTKRKQRPKQNPEFFYVAGNTLCEKKVNDMHGEVE